MSNASPHNQAANLIKNTRLVRFLSASIVVLLMTGTVWAAKPVSVENKADITMYKTASCGCCTKWTEHLEENGFSVDVKVVEDTSPIRSSLGIPRNLGSCHTAVAGNYWIEGHVPADLISQLLAEQPDDIQGLSVPGMPAGSPGMDIPDSPAYKIISVDSDGELEVYATRKGPVTR